MLVGHRSMREGGKGVFLEQKGEMKDPRLDLVLVDHLYKKGGLMMKLDQVSD